MFRVHLRNLFQIDDSFMVGNKSNVFFNSSGKWLKVHTKPVLLHGGGDVLCRNEFRNRASDFVKQSSLLTRFARNPNRYSVLNRRFTWDADIFTSQPFDFGLDSSGCSVGGSPGMLSLKGSSISPVYVKFVRLPIVFQRRGSGQP